MESRNLANNDYVNIETANRGHWLQKYYYIYCLPHSLERRDFKAMGAAMPFRLLLTTPPGTDP